MTRTTLNRYRLRLTTSAVLPMRQLEQAVAELGWEVWQTKTDRRKDEALVFCATELEADEVAATLAGRLDTPPLVGVLEPMDADSFRRQVADRRRQRHTFGSTNNGVPAHGPGEFAQ